MHTLCRILHLILLCSIDKMEVEPELPLPALSEESDLIKESHLKAVSYIKWTT